MVLVYVEGRSIKATAGAAITAGQLVELTGDETVAPTSGASSKVLGVAMKDAAAGEQVTVITEGVVEVTAAGAISAGDLVQSAANGQVEVFSATKTYTDSGGNTVSVDDVTMVVGRAITSAAAAGDKVKIKLEV
ncbi:DUF2190 family protein [Geoglobus acetivorans]|uniref:Phage protein n=1 Tax=Geoglobus acetivorans TaxID=565033 RepID=A0A0A7GCW3_GEOAI|nr:Phage protein [Geoglobus acetivorans]